ncbi:MAG TPA: hypothetical protein VKG45_01980 [Actinomycetes bacterium]|nr:hypothetical protein [Actinomycetes bacterium]
MRTIRIRVLMGFAAGACLLVALAGAPALGAPAPTTRLVSVNSAGIKANRDSRFPAVNASGSIIAFSSDATNLVSADGNDRQDVFVRDRAAATTIRASVTPLGGEANDTSQRPSIDDAGKVVGFESLATNLVGGDTNDAQDVFVRILTQPPQTRRVSVSSNGVEANDDSANAAVSPDGRYVAFASLASNLVPGDTNGMLDVFVKDLSTNAIRRIVGNGGVQGNGPSGIPSISADGTWVAFESRASNLVPGDTNQQGDVFVQKTATGATARVSVNSAGAQGNRESRDPSISADGRHVAFASDATNLVGRDGNRSSDVFVHTLAAGTTERVSVNSAGVEGNGPSSEPSISTPPDQGIRVAFTSSADNLIASDTNLRDDVFRHDSLLAQTTRWSVTQNGSQASGGNSAAPAITRSGDHIAFSSLAQNLVPGDGFNSLDVFVRGP